MPLGLCVCRRSDRVPSVCAGTELWLIIKDERRALSKCSFLPRLLQLSPAALLRAWLPCLRAPSFGAPRLHPERPEQRNSGGPALPVADTAVLNPPLQLVWCVSHPGPGLWVPGISHLKKQAEVSDRCTPWDSMGPLSVLSPSAQKEKH